MSGNGRCYGNARCESFFATLKKEKLYQINTANLPMETVKSIIWRFIEIYCSKRRVYTTNGGYPPLVYRSMYYSESRKQHCQIREAELPAAPAHSFHNAISLCVWAVLSVNISLVFSIMKISVLKMEP